MDDIDGVWCVSLHGPTVFIIRRRFLLSQILYFPALVFTWTFEAYFLTVIIVFSILTVCYIHKNTIDQDPQLKNSYFTIFLNWIFAKYCRKSISFFDSFDSKIFWSSRSGISYTHNSRSPIFHTTSDHSHCITPIVMMIILKPLYTWSTKARPKKVNCLLQMQGTIQWWNTIDTSTDLIEDEHTYKHYVVSNSIDRNTDFYVQLMSNG